MSVSQSTTTAVTSGTPSGNPFTTIITFASTLTPDYNWVAENPEVYKQWCSRALDDNVQCVTV